jgi:hypothetical protein
MFAKMSPVLLSITPILDQITRKNCDLNKEMKEAILKPRKSLVTFEPNKVIREFQTNVDSFGDLIFVALSHVEHKCPV